MARYIKANQKVAAYLHLENDRLKLKDGNYILWQGDMTAFGPLPMLNDTLTKIGGIALMPHEAKQEQDGTVVRPLPVATDERFIMETVTEQPEDENNTTDVQPDGDGNTHASEERAKHRKMTRAQSIPPASHSQKPAVRSRPTARVNNQKTKPLKKSKP